MRHPFGEMVTPSQLWADSTHPGLMRHADVQMTTDAWCKLSSHKPIAVLFPPAHFPFRPTCTSSRSDSFIRLKYFSRSFVYKGRWIRR
jgi:hypothetical protein